MKHILLLLTLMSSLTAFADIAGLTRDEREALDKSLAQLTAQPQYSVKSSDVVRVPVSGCYEVSQIIIGDADQTFQNLLFTAKICRDANKKITSADLVEDKDTFLASLDWRKISGAESFTPSE